MSMSYGLFSAGALTVMVTLCGVAEARPLNVRDSAPAAGAIFDGRSRQYVIRFDGLVDHRASRVEITQEGKVVKRLVPTLDSEPDVLAALAPALSPGRYELHWRAQSLPDGDFSEGSISFTVGR
jgi:methionine-rich copper-binding protein CopC